MHSGQRLCSGHLSNEACKVLTSSLGHLFSPLSSSLFRLQLPPVSFLPPWPAGWGGVGWGLGEEGRRGLKKDLVSPGGRGAGSRPPGVCPSSPASSGPGSHSSPRKDALEHPGASEAPKLSGKKRAQPARLRRSSHPGAAAFPTPGGRPAATGPPPGPLGPSGRLCDLYPHFTPVAGEKVRVCGGGGRETETNNKPPPATRSHLSCSEMNFGKRLAPNLI